MLKVLVADDERIARNIIVMLLEQSEQEVTILQAADGVEALSTIKSQAPDIVFLDIQMPGYTGMQLAEQLGDTCVVIFVTAYDEYAVKAFELSAVDYLLKPFEDRRFFDAFERAQKRLHNQRQQAPAGLSELLEYTLTEQKSRYKSRLVVKEAGRIRLLDTVSINFIKGAGNYAEVHLLDGAVVLHRETLSTLEQQLDPDHFARIHRSAIVCKDSISELHPTVKGDYQVILKSRDRLTLSRRHKANLEELFS